MRRRKFSPEFDVEAVRLVRERGVSAAQVARDLDVHENVLRKWVKEFAASSAGAYPTWSDEARTARIEYEGLRSSTSALARDLRSACALKVELMLSAVVAHAVGIE
jgi:transposase